MKLETLQIFEDLKEKTLRKVGEVFEVTYSRGKELLDKLPKGYVKEVKETSKKTQAKKVEVKE